MIPSDTLLAKFVREFGDTILTLMVEDFYPSALFKLIVFAAAVIMFIQTGISLHRGRLSSYVKIFWITWLCAMPVRGKPALYYFVTTGAELLTNQMQKTTHNLITQYGGKRPYPPGFVAKTLLTATTYNINDEEVKRGINTSIQYCIPFGTITVNGKKRKINASDLFRVDIVPSSTGANMVTFPFPTTQLKNRKVMFNGLETNCHQVLSSTILKLYNELTNPAIFRVDEKSITNSTGSVMYPDRRNWEFTDIFNTPLGKTAMNLAAASSIQREIIAQNSDLKIDDTNFASDVSPMVDPIKQRLDNNLTDFSFHIMNTAGSVLRSFNNDKWLDNASTMVDLNKKLRKLPYYVSTILIFLKMLFPFVLFTPFLSGSFRVVHFWVTAYFTAHTVPWLMMISRSICNSLLVHASKIHTTVQNYEEDPSFLKLGISFEGANNLIEDSNVFLNTYIETENALWTSLLFAAPIISWFASGMSNQAGSKLGSSIANSAGYHSTRVATNTGMKAATAGGKLALKTAVLVGKPAIGMAKEILSTTANTKAHGDYTSKLRGKS